MWLKITREGLRRFWSVFPLSGVPFWYRFFEPQPHQFSGNLKMRFLLVGWCSENASLKAGQAALNRMYIERNPFSFPLPANDACVTAGFTFSLRIPLDLGSSLA